MGQARDLASAQQIASAMESTGKRDEELLEFCFRRVHEGLSDGARRVLAALSLDERPQGREPLSVATGLSAEIVDEALSLIEQASLVERVWEDASRDYTYRVLPMTRRFARREIQTVPNLESTMRKRLTDWYEGRDVPEQLRKSIAVARRGNRDPGAQLIDAAAALRRDRKTDEAEKLLNQAIARNPRQWRAHRELGEVFRTRGSLGDAIEEYEKAVANAPSRGNDRALIFREYGMVLRQSGRRDGAEQAVRAFEIALRETPHDPVLQHALAKTYVVLEHYAKAIPLLETLCGSKEAESRGRSYALLEDCYRRTGEILKAEELRDRRASDFEASLATDSQSQRRKG